MGKLVSVAALAICAVMLAASAQPAAAAPVVIESFDAGRTDGEWGLTETDLTITRGYIEDPANFGPGGTVQQSYQVGPGVSVASAATLAGADVFFTGWVSTGSYTAAEKTALRNFVLGGGSLVATTDDTGHTMVDVFGLTQGDGNGNPTVNTITNPTHPIANGPFGTVTTYNQYALTGHYPSLGSDAQEVGENAQGTTIAVIERGVLGPGSGAVVLVADVDVFSNANPGAVENETLIKNIFAFVIPVPAELGYARPKSAALLSFQLVPAFAECPGGNAVHGPPLDSASCNPPSQSSAFLTFNAPDRPAPYSTTAAGSGSLVLKVFCTNGAAPPCTGQVGDQQDVRITTDIAGVRCVAVSGGCSAAGGLYGGKVLGLVTLRMTDRLNAGTNSGTVADVPFGWGVQCAAGACSSTTSADAVVPDLVKEQKRAIWAVSDLRILDGGSDGKLLATLDGTCPPACEENAGETVFLQQGLFTP